MNFFARAFCALAVVVLALPVSAQQAIFPKIRAQSLFEVRAFAMKRSPAIAISGARVGAAQAEEREVSRRFKVQTTGGLDPFSGSVRFYVALDLERLAGLNKAERQSARQRVEQEKLGAIGTSQDAIKRVSAAWYGLTGAQMAVESANRRKETANALYLAVDARFKAGQAELSGVLSALSGTSTAEDSYQSARQSVALSCLELAQSCGYLTAEEMEAAL